LLRIFTIENRQEVFKMKMEGLTFLILGVMSSQLSATVIYDDGGTHFVDSFINDNIVLENYSDLEILGGGLVITPGSDYAVHATSVGSGVNGSSVNMSGDASVVGGIRMNNSESLSSSVTTGGNSSVTGLGVGRTGDGRAAITGAYYVEINDNSSITGATSGERGGAAIENGDSGHYRVTVNGGELVGGHGGQTGGYGIDSDVDPIYLGITGGTIRGGNSNLTGGVGVVNMDYGSVLMTDGAIYGGEGGATGGEAFYSYGSLDMSIVDGQIQGGNGSAYGGSGISTATYSGEPANIHILGGEFDAGLGSVADGWIFNVTGSGSNVSIFGGAIGYDAVGAGINIDFNGLVEVYGWGLTLSGGQLTGYLLDGSRIETPVTVAGITQPRRGLRLFNLGRCRGILRSTGVRITDLPGFVKNRLLSHPCARLPGRMR
jgi:hypothetical protein